MTSTGRLLRLLSLPLLASLLILAMSGVAEADTLSDLAGRFDTALSSESYALALGVCFLAGLFTAFTPCVYPMIAITVSVFGAREARSRFDGAMLSGVFVLGIAALFTPLGILSAMTGTAMGFTAGSPWVLIPLSIIFLAMALSMFGAFDLALPAAMQNRLAQVGGSGLKGAFGVGVVNGLIAAPCTGPVLTVLLTWVATTNDVAFGGLALFVYSLGLGTLFFFVGTFAVSLPKSGAWLDGVKSVFGVVMVAVALYYLRNVLPIPRPEAQTNSWLGASALLALVGVALGAIHLSFKQTSLLERARKGMGISLSVVGLLGAVLWSEALPPLPAGAQINWLDDYAAAREMAEAERRPLLVDFGADWCMSCKELEHEVLIDPRVVSESRRFVSVRVDMTDISADETALLASYEQPGLPLVVMHNGDGSEQARVTGMMDAEAFLSLLRATH